MRLKEKHFRDGDGDSDRDRLFESVEGSLDNYLALFKRLQERARQHGISTVVVVSTSDPLTGFSTYRIGTMGNWLQNSGAVRAALRDWEVE